MQWKWCTLQHKYANEILQLEIEGLKEKLKKEV
jgi:hypothetical protein